MFFYYFTLQTPHRLIDTSIDTDVKDRKITIQIAKKDTDHRQYIYNIYSII